MRSVVVPALHEVLVSTCGDLRMRSGLFRQGLLGGCLLRRGLLGCRSRGWSFRNCRGLGWSSLLGRSLGGGLRSGLLGSHLSLEFLVCVRVYDQFQPNGCGCLQARFLLSGTRRGTGWKATYANKAIAFSRLAGSSTLAVTSARSICRFSPLSTRPGPTSM